MCLDLNAYDDANVIDLVLISRIHSTVAVCG